MRRLATGIFILSLSFSIQAQELTTEHPGITESNNALPTEPQVPYAVKGAAYDSERDLFPYFSEVYGTGSGGSAQLQLNDVVTKPVSAQAVQKLKKHIGNDFTISLSYGTSRGQRRAYATINALRYNPSTGQPEELVSYVPQWNVSNGASYKTSSVASFSTTSVLASGTWYKIAVAKNGVYKIDKTLLTKLGIDIADITPQNIRIYGNGGKMLPEMNNVARFDDLQENAIVVNGEADGVFDPTDYILFYGQGSDNWTYTPGGCLKFEHQLHYYSDTTYYYLNLDLGPGKRIVTQNSTAVPANYNTSSYDYYGYHEDNSKNLVKSGREFYGEYFDLTTSYNFNFAIPNAVIGDSVAVKTSLISRSDFVSSYTTNYNSGSHTFTCVPTATGNYIADIGFPGEGCSRGLLSSSALSVLVTKTTTQAVGWLDAVVFNCRANLIFNQGQLSFRDTRTMGAGRVTNFGINTIGSSTVMVWEVSDPLNVRDQALTVSGTSLSFILPTDTLREFIAFNNNSYLTPTAYGPVANQNLHALQPASYIIIAHPSYVPYAQRLASLHQQYDTLNSIIVTTEEIYNEFSSGSPDIVALRDFVRMLYKRAGPLTDAPQYLLLFGDGSYKNKDRYAFGNSAMVPVYETHISTSYTVSYTSDDFFGLMDDLEGDLGSNDLIDLGVGRLPVRSKEEANNVVNKIENYYKKNPGFTVEETQCCNTATSASSMGDWRNWLCFVGDDEDNGVHEDQADQLATMVTTNYKDYNVDKIYFDAYVQYTTPGGQRYPDVEADLDKRVEKGALILNYTGHGGETGLAHERILGVSQILGYDNLNSLPLWVTATCELSRYDDPDRTSAGEYILLNPNGAGIALMTTVRVAFAGSNFVLNSAFYNFALEPLPNGKMPALGDVYRETKVQIGGNLLYRNFALLGDPAMVLAYPKERVYTTAINSIAIINDTAIADTLKALSKVTITGYVGDKSGNKLTSFNGVVYPTVYDKAQSVTTLSNDGVVSPPFTFKLQKNALYKGKAQVTNGDFSFTFIVPKDISYNYGVGKISYYAQNGLIDANGYSNNAVIGGSDPNAHVDSQGPTVRLYMNDEKFVSGGTTNENPNIYALMTDSSGINTAGTGIGHDLVAVLDANSDKPIVLNDYYEADLNSFQSGKVNYPFKSLAEGTHNISMKVWDIQNNSTSAYTEFVVAKSAEIALSHVLNYPNPFTTHTQFFIEHNQNCTSLKVQVQIFTITGKIVKTINETIKSQGFRLDGIEWDGRDDYGDKLARGVYVYRVKVTDDQNKHAEKIEKLVILN